jgi:hypothetical protein
LLSGSSGFTGGWFRLLLQKKKTAIAMAMTATTLTATSADINVLFVEGEAGGEVSAEPVGPDNSAPGSVFAVVAVGLPPGEVVSAVLSAGCAVNPLSEQ